jgi:transposase-like protein
VTTERNFHRSELYALVWSKPILQVAADIGVPDVAVAKACRKHGIPLPARGSWARRQYGHQASQPPLPALPDGSDPIISFHVGRRSSGQTAPWPAEVETELRPENRIVVPETVESLHRAVRHTRATLLRCKPGSNGLLGASAIDCLNVSVSPSQLERTYGSHGFYRWEWRIR